MSDVDLDGAGAESGDASTGEGLTADETPTDANQAPDLAGDSVETVSENNKEDKSPSSPRGTKRRLSGENAGGGDVAGKTPASPRGAKRRLSGENAGGGDVAAKTPASPHGTKRRLSGESAGGGDADKCVNDENGESVDEVLGNKKSVENTPKPQKEEESNSKTAADVGDKSKSKAEDGESHKQTTDVVIEISDDSSDSSICAVDSYQASAAELKRIRGDDYSSSSDYSSDSSSSCDDESVVLGNTRRARSLVSSRVAQLNPRAARTDEPQLNKTLREADTTDKLSSHWAQNHDLNEENVSLKCEPFKLCLLHNVLSNPEIINNIVDDMNTLDWSRKKMDLYEFHQTTDLANLTWQRSIRGIYDLLKNDIMPWISRVTGLTLTHTSASCSLYGPGDHLLVHDDLLADRKVAFILYLAPWTLDARRRLDNGERAVDKDKTEQEIRGGWSSWMGGALELLECDASRQPTRVARSVLPRNNTLAFFQVTPESFHQVSEVKSLEFPRLSINGWFHGPDAAGATHDEPERLPPVAFKPHTEIVLMSAWLNPQYLAPRTRLQIQQQMEKASEISLQQFLVPEKYSAVVELLAATETEWEEAGPANQRRYDRLQLERLEGLERTHALREFVKLFTSGNMYKFLHDCSDLTLKSHFHMEVQRWRANSFTVLPPKESYSQNQLDLVMYLGFPERAVCGGITTYVAPEEENAPPLVSLEPKNNALNLVYADSQTARFTKHVSAMTMRPEDCFYILTCSFKEELP